MGERPCAVESMDLTFAKQTVVITGASSGIGQTIALDLGSKGAALCLVGRDLESMRKVAARIPVNGSHPLPPVVKCYQADLSSASEMQRVASQLVNDHARVDILVHSAGAISQGRVESSPVEELDRQYQTNLRAPYVLTQALLPALKAARGQIVFINSTVGHTARAEVSQYAATKHGLSALASSLRDEINGDGIRVLNVFLGRTATPMQAAVFASEGRVYQPERLIQPEDVSAVVLNALSLPRTAEVTEIRMRPLLKS